MDHTFIGPDFISRLIERSFVLWDVSPVDTIILALSGLSLFWLVKHIIQHIMIYRKTGYARTKSHILEHLSVAILVFTLQGLGMIYHSGHFASDDATLATFLLNVDFLSIISGLFGVFNIWLCKLQRSEIMVEHNILNEVYKLRKDNAMQTAELSNVNSKLTTCLIKTSSQANENNKPPITKEYSRWGKFTNIMQILRGN